MRRDRRGRVVETPSGLFRRVARNVAAPEAKYGGRRAVNNTAQLFFEMMFSRDFLPNSPTLMNAGAPLQQLAACFVLPVKDSLEEIFETLKQMALIHRSGGGTGFSFSALRPAGALLMSTKGTSSGPVSFMRVYSATTEVIKQGGKRRGANMGILRVDHPDILEFINCKLDGAIRNFNISVAVDDAFMRAVKRGQNYALRDPRHGQIVKRLPASKIFKAIARAAWATGDPGMLFLDRVNRDNPTPKLGKIEATNPCGEQPLLPYEACHLGSINLNNFVVTRQRGQPAIDWERLKKTTRLAVQFLDNTIDMSRFPVKEITLATKRTRKIGLGVMGFADLLLALGVPYESNQALEIAGKLAKFLRQTADEKSAELGRERGAFTVWSKSRYRHGPRLRNATRLTIAPTGTLSMIAECSSGIEPFFALAYRKNVLEGKSLPYVNQAAARLLKNTGAWSAKLSRHLLATGRLSDEPGLSPALKSLLATAYEISPRWHVMMQAAWQKHVDNAISKTINLPASASVNEIAKVYQLAHDLDCKGVTVYRDQSKPTQVLVAGAKGRGVKIEPQVGCPDCEVAIAPR